jgi:signal transduction histidine kinase
MLGAVVTSWDITARRRVEKEKEDLVVELRRSNDELAQFAHVVSHDLRAPLRAIDSLAHWLEEDLRPHLTPDTAQQLSLLQSRVRRMEALVGDLLDFARLGRAEAKTASVDVEALIAEVIDLTSVPATFRVVTSISVTTVDTAALPLKRALLNLVGNALKHHDRTEGEIRISVIERGAFLEFAVTDDGPGIPSPFHEKIFEPFQTLKPRDELEGSGMGLAFVRKIAGYARGTVTVESIGRGATFRLRWPKVWRPWETPA